MQAFGFFFKYLFSIKQSKSAWQIHHTPGNEVWKKTWVILQTLESVSALLKLLHFG